MPRWNMRCRSGRSSRSTNRRRTAASALIRRAPRSASGSRPDRCVAWQGPCTELSYVATSAGTMNLDDLVGQLPDGAVGTAPAGMDSYRWDRARDPEVGLPLAVVRAATTEDVQLAVRCAGAP